MKLMKNRLVELRKEKKLTQQDIATMLGERRSTVGHWETGHVNIDLENLKKLAEFYNVTIDYILGYEPTDDPQSVYHDAMEIINKLDIKPDKFKNLTDEQIELAKQLLKTIQEQNKK